MKEPKWDTCNEREFWEYIATHLKARGISSVLVGGAVASIYTEGLYRSGDVDLLTYEHTMRELEEALLEINFEKRGMHYRHPSCAHLYLQIVSGPLGIGDDIKIDPLDVKVDGQVIKILAPTDCIRDRLIAYREDKTHDLLDLAVKVALMQPFEDKKIKRWCASENMMDIYREFERLLKLEKSRQ